MSTIKDYKLIQSDSNKQLAIDVMEFIKLGWEPLKAPLITGTISLVTETVNGTPRVTNEIKTIYAQAIVLREPEHAELERLRDLESHVSQIVTELDAPCAGEAEMLTFAHEELTKVLRGGRFERVKP